MPLSQTVERGFTLIELSIVLVIIGLIVGGVLVGQDLIRAAGVRATISQIEKYNTAANTFRDKYGGLPGDLNANAAAQFGYSARGPYAGEGDGNGVIEGISGTGAGMNNGVQEFSGETVAFWVDLSTARLIDNTFTTGTETYLNVLPNPMTSTSSPNLGSLFPSAKIGRGNYIYVYSSGWTASDQQNYFGLSAVISDPWGNEPTSNPGLAVQEASAIDKKIDDGFPQSGNATATYISTGNGAGHQAGWAAGGGLAGASSSNGPTTSATPGSATTCYDNGGVLGATQQYSVEISNGSNVNCALSFRFQ